MAKGMSLEEFKAALSSDATIENEARKLFTEWKHDNKYNIPKCDVSIIYNKEDQEEYGDDYIDPRNGDKKLWQI